MQLPATTDAASLARAFIVSNTADLPAQATADAQLLASELVTNAIRYGAPPVWLTLSVSDRRLRISVHDSGGVLAEPDLPATWPQEGGYGLLLVERIASDWGIAAQTGPKGKDVWFEIGLPPGRSDAPDEPWTSQMGQ